MHKKNIHKTTYNFDLLIKANAKLQVHVFVNEHQTHTIDFSNPEAVKELNRALLFAHYSITYWEFPDENLCPPIPGRVDYIHHLAALLKASKLSNNITVLDVGTGASCIYPLLGHTVYDWSFIASDIDRKTLKSAQNIIDKNALSKHIELRYQENEAHILKGVLKPSEKLSACLCNPPFFKSAEEAQEATSRKLKGLGNKNDTIVRNFSGTSNELWFKGGEKAFLHSYLYESSLFKQHCFWYTSLVSNKELVKSMYKSLKKLNATEVKTINMFLGNKISRVVVWTFLTKDEQKKWMEDESHS